MLGKFLIAVAAVISVVHAGEISFRECAAPNEDHSTVSNVYFDGCDAAPCTVYMGSNETVLVNFTAGNILAERLACDMKFDFNGIEIEYPGGCPQRQGCLDMVDTGGVLNEGQCPVYPGEIMLYKSVFPILYTFPQGDIIQQINLWSENEGQESKLLMCVEFDIIIAHPPNK